MALSTYTELKQVIADWSHRTDLTTRLDDFIQIAENEMFANSVEILRTRGEETLATAALSTTTRFLALPTRFREMRRIGLLIDDSWRRDIRYRTPEQLPIISSGTGIPTFFTVTSQLEFDVVGEFAYTVEMQYLADIAPLTEANPTNDILTNFPNVYRFGCLWAAGTYIEDYEKAANHYNMFMNAIKGANRHADAGRYGPAPIMRIEGCTP